MRVPVGRRRKHDETGAVAVLVALLSVALIGVSAFTVDFGMAYVNNRQLQVASDAAALAAAAAYGNGSGGCATRRDNAALLTAAQAQADAERAQNRPGSTGSITDVSCTSDGKGVQVTYSSSASTSTVTGGIFGHTSGYGGTRVATAAVRPSGGAIGVRPYALCSALLPTTVPSPVVKISMPSSANSQCPTANGNWWEIDCPETANNSNSDLGVVTLTGCASPIYVVPDQGTRTGSDLRNYLVNYCPVRSSSCLSANTGNISGVVLSDWNSLAQTQAHIFLPVFCGAPPCDQSAIVPLSGNNVIYPVQGFVGVIVCGYHFGNNPGPNPGNSNAIPMTGDCGGTNNPQNYNAGDGAANDNYLLLRLIHLQTSGGPPDLYCGFGDSCDPGSGYAVNLIQ